MKITSLPLEVITIIFTLLGKDVVNALSVCKLFFHAYRCIIHETPPKYILPRTWGGSSNPGGRAHGDDPEAVSLVCDSSLCPSVGVPYERFCDTEAYENRLDSINMNYDEFSLRCPDCLHRSSTLAPARYVPNDWDITIRKEVLYPETIIGLVLYGIAGFSRNMAYKKCAIAKHKKKAIFDARGAPTNRSAEIVHKYKFLASISLAKTFTERVSAYIWYMKTAAMHPAPKQTAADAARV